MQFRVLGPLEVLDAGRQVPVGGSKQRRVLAMLLLRAGTAVRSDVLADAVWGNEPPASSHAVLQVYVANLRRVLEPDRGRGVASARLLRVADGYLLRVGRDETDTGQFYRLLEEAEQLREDAASRAERLGRAESLWRGAPFPDLEEFAPPELTRLTEDRLEAIEERVEAQLASGRHNALLGELAELIAQHPLRERLRRQRVLALYRAGRQAEALESYRAAREELMGELGIDPSPAFQALERAVLGQDPALEPPAAQGARPQSDDAGRLPVPATPLIGRQQDLLALLALLAEPEVRLVTLQGPGGSGKTRIAIAAAARAREEGEYGAVYFAALSAVSDPDLVLPAIARAVGVDQPADTPLALRLRSLGARPLLVVMDNLEQVAAAAPAVAELLAGVPTLTVLATSRTALRIAAEHLQLVPPLPPEEAAALFLQRARVARPGAVLDRARDTTVAAICTRLDGLPLAIELAAARLQVLDVHDVLVRLEHRLPLLTGGPRDAPERQRTLRATMAWSHDLLCEAERALFARLSVFAVATLSAVETVCGGGSVDDPLDALQGLVDNSLVTVLHVEEEPRFCMLQTVREYAEEQLVARPDADEVRRRHAAYCLARAEEAERDLTGAGQLRGVRRVQAEYDDLQSALTWALAAGADEVALRLAGALSHFWEMTSRFEEGRRLLAAALQACPAHAPAARAKALSGAGTLAHRQGDHESAARHHREALELYRGVGDEEGAAFSYNNLAVQAAERGEFELAEQLLEQALQLTRDPRLSAFAHGNLGEIALNRGDTLRATELHTRALQDNVEAQDEWGTLVSTYNLGVALIHRGALPLAARRLQEGLTRAHALGDPTLLAGFLGGLAVIAARTGLGALAARLLGAVEALQASRGAAVSSQDATMHTAAAQCVHDELDDAAFEAEWARGHAWTLEEAVHAGALVPPGPGVGESAAPADRWPHGVANGRESPVSTSSTSRPPQP